MGGSAGGAPGRRRRFGRRRRRRGVPREPQPGGGPTVAAEAVAGPGAARPVRLHQPWLAVLFTSATCLSCSKVEAMVQPLASPQVAVAVLAWQEHKPVHERYGIE